MSAYNLEKDLCRCCHAEGSFLNLAEPVYHSGKKEIYSEMLRNTLDIDILQTAGELHKKTYKICGQCVLRLRDANDFKLQVTLCEQRFKEMCHNYNLLAHTTIKVEIEQPETSQQDSESNLCPEMDLNIKMEPADPNLDPEDYGMDSDNVDGTGTPPSIEITLKKSTEETEEFITGDLDTPSSSKKTVNLVKNKSVKARDLGLHSEIDIKAEPFEEFMNEPQDRSVDYDDAVHNRGTPPSSSAMKPIESKPNPETPDQQTDEKKIYSCQICEKTFIRKTNLDIHLKIHTAEKKFACPYCDKRFLYKCYLLKHMRRVHTTDKPYACEFCDKKFGQPHDLQMHSRIHAGKKPVSGLFY